jgi:5-methylcytosine-specific restriction protein A
MGKRNKERLTPFAVDLDEADIRLERGKARALRQSQWWKRRLAKGRCHYCGRPTSPGDLTMDHIVPVARGGRSTRGNVVPACKTCNSAKQQLLPIEWAAYLASVQSPAGDDG